MKNLKVVMCALLVLCSGFIFAACGDDNDKDFDVSKITVGENTHFTYDGKSHVLEVSYADTNLDIDVEFAVSAEEDAGVDKDDFDDEINLVDAGTYHVYYKLSADGYKDYISKMSTMLTITPKTIDINIYDLVQFKSEGITNSIVPSYSFAHGAVVKGDVVPVYFTVGDPLDDGDAFNKTTVQPGRSFKVNAVSLNSNYVVNGDGKMYVKDLVEVIKDNTTNYYGTIEAAIEAAPVGSTIKLNKDIIVDETVDINKSVTIDGQGEYSIIASNDFDSKNVVAVQTAGIEVTLKGVTVDGNAKARAVMAKKGKLTLEDTHVINGKAQDYVGGVYVTSNAQFVMTGGSIKNNTFTDIDGVTEYYEKYSTDLWIGANATGAVNEITDAKIGKIFVNANEYGIQEESRGSFTLNGGDINTVYVEYHNGEGYDNYGAKFIYKKGNIKHLLVSATVSGEFAEISVPTTETTIMGGVIGTSTNAEGVTVAFNDPTEFMTYAYQHLEDYKKVYLCDSFWLENTINRVQEVVLIGDITMNKSQAITFTDTDSLVLNGQNKYTIKASETFTGDNLFNITGNDADAVVTLKDITLDGNNKVRVVRVDSGKLVVDGATITKGLAKDYVGGVFITSRASFELIKGSITGNSYAGATATDEYYKLYSADLWIGANATGSMAAINGGTVGKIYVNANSWSATNKGYFTMNNGDVESVYVEFDATYGAEFNYVGGEIDKLYLSTQTTGTFQTIENPEVGSYVGGTGVVA